MKANELMIGDWVHIKDALLPPVYSKVCSIYPPYILLKGELGQFRDDTLAPIPLTPEILEKNGFELRRETVWRWTSDDERTSIRIVLGSDYMYIIKNAYYEDEVEFSLPCPNVVHELQHALRLCGIDKEIVL